MSTIPHIIHIYLYQQKSTLGSQFLIRAKLLVEKYYAMSFHGLIEESELRKGRLHSCVSCS